MFKQELVTSTDCTLHAYVTLPTMVKKYSRVFIVVPQLSMHMQTLSSLAKLPLLHPVAVETVLLVPRGREHPTSPSVAGQQGLGCTFMPIAHFYGQPQQPSQVDPTYFI